MKYVLTIFITAVVVGVGAYIYFKGLPTFPAYNKSPISTESGTTIPPAVQTAPPSSTPSNVTTVKAGGILVFSPYSIDIPNSWTYTKQAAPTGDIAIDKLVITKGAYSITIYEAATGGAPCLYPGDADVEGPSSRFTSSVDITTVSGDKLRRGTAQGSTSGFTVCELQSGGYGQPTTFGHISIASPVSPSTSVLTEVDAMLASLKKL